MYLHVYGIIIETVHQCLEFIFINDDTQEVERFFSGDYDTYGVSRAQWWAEKFVASEYKEIERGLIQRKKLL